jgi:hypothetical protein
MEKRDGKIMFEEKRLSKIWNRELMSKKDEIMFSYSFGMMCYVDNK